MRKSSNESIEEKEEEDDDQGLSGKGGNVVPSASSLWEAYLDGERDMRTAYTTWNSIGESMEQYKVYCQYRLWGAVSSKNNNAASASSKSGRNTSSAKESIKESNKGLAKSSSSRINGNEEVTRLLFEMCRDPNMSTFLLLQALDHGADLKWISPQGDSILHLLAATHEYDALACVLSPVHCMKSSLTNNRGQTPLIVAAIKPYLQAAYTEKQKKTIKLLLEQRDVKINHIDADGCTALYYAWKAEDVWLVCKLLRRQASVLSTLSLFARTIPLLSELDLVLSHVKDPQIQIRRIKEKTELSVFLSTTELAEDMLDFYSLSSSAWLVKTTLSKSKKEIIAGMLLFRIREELRYLKSADPPKVPQVAEVLAQEKLAETEDRFARDLEVRDKYRVEHKLGLKQEVNHKKEKALYKEWDRKRQNHLDRLEKEYDAKITGLYV